MQSPPKENRERDRYSDGTAEKRGSGAKIHGCTVIPELRASKPLRSERRASGAEKDATSRRRCADLGHREAASTNEKQPNG
jgi:hypothetical protein